MTDLLVSSLMVDGGLQMALTAAIKVEVQDLEDTCFEKESEQVSSHLFKVIALISCPSKKVLFKMNILLPGQTS